MTNFGGIRFALIATSFLSVPLASGGVTAQPDPLMPSLVIPEKMPSLVIPEMEAKPVQNLAAHQTEPSAQDFLMKTIREEALRKYVDTDSGSDPDRITALVNGEYLSDYIRPTRNPVQFSNNTFVKPQKEAPVEPEAPAHESRSRDMRSALMSPAGIRAMSNMSRDQIEAIALMVEIMENPGMDVPDHLTGPGIPGLSEEDLANMSPDQVRTLMRGEQQRRVVDVGDGKNMVLANWYAGTNEHGVTYIENDRMAGSRLEVKEGMIFGEFGGVTDISMDGVDKVVTFHSGDQIRSRPAVPRVAGVPALSDNIDDERSGEIIISIPAPGPSKPEAADGDEEASIDTTVRVNEDKDGLGATRPPSRPDSFKDRFSIKTVSEARLQATASNKRPPQTVRASEAAPDSAQHASLTRAKIITDTLEGRG